MHLRVETRGGGGEGYETIIMKMGASDEHQRNYTIERKDKNYYTTIKGV